MSEDKSAISANLKRLREARGLNQKAFPGVSYRTIQNIEAGITDGGAAAFIAISRVLQVSVDRLIGNEEFLTTPEEALAIVAEALKEHRSSNFPALPDPLRKNPDFRSIIDRFIEDPTLISRVLNLVDAAALDQVQDDSSGDSSGSDDSSATGTKRRVRK